MRTSAVAAAAHFSAIGSSATSSSHSGSRFLFRVPRLEDLYRPDAILPLPGQVLEEQGRIVMGDKVAAKTSTCNYNYEEKPDLRLHVTILRPNSSYSIRTPSKPLRPKRNVVVYGYIYAALGSCCLLRAWPSPQTRPRSSRRVPEYEMDISKSLQSMYPCIYSTYLCLKSIKRVPI